MAIKGSATITLTQYRDTQSVTRYYKLQPTGSSAPLKPETKPPSSDWTDSEPACDISKELYFCDLTIFSNGECEYSTVSKSSSYEAAKEAYNKADNAQTTANNAHTAIDTGLTDLSTSVGETIEGLYTDFDEKISSSITDVTDRITSEVSRLDQEIGILDSKSLISLGYATLEADSLVIKDKTKTSFVSLLPEATRLVNIGDDTNSYLELTSNSIDLMTDDIRAATIYKNDLGEGILEVPNASISILKMRSVSGENRGKFAWVAQSNGHLSLKEVL